MPLSVNSIHMLNLASNESDPRMYPSSDEQFFSVRRTVPWFFGKENGPHGRFSPIGVSHSCFARFSVFTFNTGWSHCLHGRDFKPRIAQVRDPCRWKFYLISFTLVLTTPSALFLVASISCSVMINLLGIHLSHVCVMIDHMPVQPYPSYYRGIGSLIVFFSIP